MADPVRVAVQGDPGCFSHAAVLGHFGALELVPCHDFPELFAAVLDGRADAGCVPVENALAGAVAENLDLLVHHPVHAIAETYVRVEMCLAVRPGTRPEELRAIASHPVALRQCRRFLAERPDVEEIVARDTAGSIRDLMRANDVPWNGAIGPALAAELYGAEILARGIEDHPSNFTRFLVVARDDRKTSVTQGGSEAQGTSKVQGTSEVQGTGVRPVSKASLAFTLPHTPGSLHEAIGIFAREQLDLTRLESRPIPGRPWEYRFFVDARGEDPEAWGRSLEELGRLAGELKVIGRYAEVDVP